MNKIAQFLSEVRLEFSRVEWPSIPEWLGATRVVLFVVFLFTIYFAFVDRSLIFLVKTIFSRGLL
ncbi:MAG: Preprotein translocase, SecE subunit [candidate division TM6 bacterium GW2011_GWE2_41_16]|nr:MAG: Preprotein translocase, SecE subunit [candidate division TM6 bacterium GW2011_GWE2_41_16]